MLFRAQLLNNYFESKLQWTKNLCYKENNASIVYYVVNTLKGLFQEYFDLVLCVLYNLLKTCYIIVSIYISQFPVKL